MVLTYDSTKPVKKSISMVPEKIRTSTTIKSPVVVLDEAIPLAREMMDGLADCSEDERRNLMPSDLKKKFGDIFLDFSAAVGAVLDFEFDQERCEGFSSNLSTALNLPIICATNANISRIENKHVLILGAGKGQDISRIDHAFGGVYSNYWLDCIEPSPEGCDVLFNSTKTFEGKCRIFEGTLLEANKEGFLRDENGDRQYDLIINNLGLHNLCRTVEDTEMCFETIAFCLADNGKYIGTYIDSNAAEYINDCNQGGIAKEVSILRVSPPSDRSPEGEMKIRMGNVIFNDPILTQSRIYENLKKYTWLQPTIVDARNLFRKKDDGSGVPQFPVPKGKENRAKDPILTMIRYIEIVVRREQPKVRNALFDDTQWNVVANNRLRDFIFPVNKGRCLLPVDLPYLGAPLIAVAEKKDGIPARVLVYKNLARSLDECGVTEEMHAGFELEHQLCLQCEKVGNEYYVLDVFSFGTGDSPGSFFLRWKKLRQLFDDNLALRHAFVLNNFYMQPNAKLLENIYKRSVEGIVIQPLGAAPGVFFNQLGSARYIKKPDRITVDLQWEGKIYEVQRSMADQFRMNGKDFFRERPDKQTENTDDQIKVIKAAMLFQDYYEFYRQSTLYVSPNPLTVPTVHKMIVEGSFDYARVPINEAMVVFYGRRNDEKYQEWLLDLDKGWYRNYERFRDDLVSYWIEHGESIAQKYGVKWMEETFLGGVLARENTYVAEKSTVVLVGDDIEF